MGQIASVSATGVLGYWVQQDMAAAPFSAAEAFHSSFRSAGSLVAYLFWDQSRLGATLNISLRNLEPLAKGLSAVNSRISTTSS